MRKKIISALLCTAMVTSVLTGCGGSSDSKDSSKKADSSASSSASETKSNISSDGKVLNIYCWNDEFQRRLKDHYDGYEEVDANTGKIGDITVKWNSTPSTDNAYQNNLDAALQKHIVQGVALRSVKG